MRIALASSSPSSPHNLEAERAVLGAGLVRETAIGEARQIVEPRDFFRDAHRRIFERMIALADRNEPIDLVTLKNELGDELEDVGGPAYIAALTDGVPRSANVEYYSRIVKEQSSLRWVIARGNRAITLAHDGDLEGSLDALQTALESRGTARVDLGRGMINDVEILESPDVPQMVTHLLSTRSTYGLVGPQGCGKTTVGLTLNICIANAVDFLGHGITTSGASIYVMLEGQPLMKERIRAVKLAHGLPLDATAGLFTWLDGLDLLDPRSVRRFIAAAQPLAPVNVTIDTWAMAFTGDENSSQEVGRGMRAVQRIRDELGCAVGLIHHTNATATRERGSTAFKAAIDTLLMLTIADDALRLVVEKQRDGAAIGEIPIRLTPVPGTKAQVCRLASDVLPATELSSTQLRALSRLREDFVSGASSAEWRATLPEVPERSFFRIQAELVRRGYVAGAGRGRHVRYRVTATLPKSLSTLLP